MFGFGPFSSVAYSDALEMSAQTSAASSTLTLGGPGAALLLSATMSAFAGSLTLSGFVGSPSAGVAMGAAAGTLMLTGSGSGIIAGLTLAASPGSLALAGSVSAFTSSLAIASAAGVLSLSASPTTLVLWQVLAAVGGLLSIAAPPAGLSIGFRINAAPASLTFGTAAYTLPASVHPSSLAEQNAALAAALGITGGVTIHDTVTVTTTVTVTNTVTVTTGGTAVVVAVPSASTNNTIPPPPRLVGDPQADNHSMQRWLNALYDGIVKTTNVIGTLANLSARVTNVESNVGVSGGTATVAGVTSFNTRSGAVTLASSDVTTALGFTPGPAYSLPTASTSVLGGVKVDGSSITINGAGVISVASTGAVRTPAGEAIWNRPQSAVLGMTWTQQASSTVTDYAGVGFLMANPNASGTWQNSLLLLPKPATATWQMRARVRMGGVDSGTAPEIYTGLVLYETASGRALTHGPQGSVSSLLLTYGWTSANTPSAPIHSTGSPSGDDFFLWVQISDDGTNYNFYGSPDGVQWTRVASQVHNGFLSSAADRVGVFVASKTAAASMMVYNFELGTLAAPVISTGAN